MTKYKTSGVHAVHSLIVEGLTYVNRNRKLIMDGIPGALSSDCKFCLLARFFFFFSVALRAQRRYGQGAGRDGLASTLSSFTHSS